MQRRLFLAGGVAGLIFGTRPTGGLVLNDPPVNGLKKSVLNVGDAAGSGRATNVQSIHLWEMNLEEDDKVRFYFRLTNTGDRQVRIFHCQPWFVNNWVRKEEFGPFGKVTQRDFFKSGTAPEGWRANNDSNAFYCLINIDGRWDIMEPSQGSNDDNTAHMEWENPQQVRFEVRSYDRR